MANRDLFTGGDYPPRRTETRAAGGWLRRLMWQGLAALLLFGGVVWGYEQETELGEGVRYVVALARQDNQQAMAVNGLLDIWQEIKQPADEDKAADLNDVGDEVVGDDEAVSGDEVVGDEVDDVIGEQPDEAYLAAAVVDDEGLPVLILPTSGLMQGAFGEVTAEGLPLLGLQIFCQKEQPIKAAAIGEVTEVIDGERVVLQHTAGLETVYIGEIAVEAAVGDVLRQGEVVGRITDGMLYFQVLQDGEPYDPFLFVKGPK
ncbi:MAG: M23 family metallopeptidase [Firmicutes bacterium]|nr:M23 family metallopeptidase [Bacillota bacterium]MBQ3199283.1 M23 family metallopeptidase [Bacillota bacterium]